MLQSLWCLTLFFDAKIYFVKGHHTARWGTSCSGLWRRLICKVACMKIAKKLVAQSGEMPLRMMLTVINCNHDSVTN